MIYKYATIMNECNRTLWPPALPWGSLPNNSVAFTFLFLKVTFLTVYFFTSILWIRIFTCRNMPKNEVVGDIIHFTFPNTEPRKAFVRGVSPDFNYVWTVVVLPFCMQWCARGAASRRETPHVTHCCGHRAGQPDIWRRVTGTEQAPVYYGQSTA